MTNPEPPPLTIARTAASFRAGERSPVDLIEAILARIEAINPELNAIATVTADRAREDAGRAARELAAGRDRGPLHGIPVALKDNVDTAGIRTTEGSRLTADRVPDADSTVAARLRAAGAVLVGKANMHELALGVATTNAIFGQTRNPWAPDRIPGGSSGGSAAAVAAGLCLAAIGTDSGGSVRIPASLCGTVGLKPTHGLVSNTGIGQNYPSFDCAGPLTRTVEDAGLVLAAIAGYDPNDFATVPFPVEDLTANLPSSLRSVRIGVLRSAFAGTADEEVAEAVEDALTICRGLGASVTEVEVDGFDSSLAMAAARPELGHRHAADVATRPDAFDPEILAKLRSALELTLADHLTARRRSEHSAAALRRALVEFDVLVTPTTPIVAPGIGVERVRIGGLEVGVEEACVAYTRAINLARLPAISVPCGFSAAGLPIGLQLIGPPFGERGLVGIAHAYELAAGWASRRPANGENAEAAWTHLAH
jgi:aspartyl-tRNA(Asn)/glutamyl-tRNA(Gln) amidotransferase subunit A